MHYNITTMAIRTVGGVATNLRQVFFFVLLAALLGPPAGAVVMRPADGAGNNPTNQMMEPAEEVAPIADEPGLPIAEAEAGGDEPELPEAVAQLLSIVYAKALGVEPPNMLELQNAVNIMMEPHNMLELQDAVNNMMEPHNMLVLQDAVNIMMEPHNMLVLPEEQHVLIDPAYAPFFDALEAKLEKVARFCNHKYEKLCAVVGAGKRLLSSIHYYGTNVVLPAGVGITVVWLMFRVVYGTLLLFVHIWGTLYGTLLNLGDPEVRQNAALFAALLFVHLLRDPEVRQIAALFAAFLFVHLLR